MSWFSNAFNAVKEVVKHPINFIQDVAYTGLKTVVQPINAITGHEWKLNLKTSLGKDISKVAHDAANLYMTYNPLVLATNTITGHSFNPKYHTAIAQFAGSLQQPIGQTALAVATLGIGSKISETAKQYIKPETVDKFTGVMDKAKNTYDKGKNIVEKGSNIVNKGMTIYNSATNAYENVGSVISDYNQSNTSLSNKNQAVQTYVQPKKTVSNFWDFIYW